MESLAFIQWCLDHLNYWTVTLLMALESSFIPFPSEIVVAPAAYNAAAGELNIFLVIVFATVGACLGALVNYYLSLWIGRPLIYKFADSRLGHMLLLSGEKIERAEEFFRKHGIVSTLIGRLIPVVRQLISIPAGLARMKLSVFLLYTAIGAGIWNAVLAGLGYYFYRILPKDQLMDTVNRYSHEIGYGFLGIGILIVAYFVWQGLRHKKKDTALEEDRA
ncbi:MAG: DedA family protein [Bacteroidales bacterium]|nr:DedA family protein [Bacteroidales bacterium]